MPETGPMMAAAYAMHEGRAYFTGVETLAHLMVLQRQRDAAAGLNTAGFVSGYRGSPLGGMDRTFWRWQTHLEAHRIRFQPAINEELAATAVLGTQQVNLHPGAKYDGVFAMWYGKGPGSDRAGDALKHANSLGTSPLGGALVVVGDDHGAVSSSMAHQCEQLMASWMMPVLHPASIREYLEFGLLGFALSRYSGCYVGFKAVSSVVEAAASIELELPDLVIRQPEDFEIPEAGVHIRWPDPQLAQEARLQLLKIPAAEAFARANRIDRLIWDTPRARYGIVAVGKAYTDLRQALSTLGIDEQRAAQLGLRLYKVGMPWPLEPIGITDFARGLEKVLVVEEKRGVIESQLKELLYGLPEDQRPAVHGKRDAAGAALLPAIGELDSTAVASVLTRWLPSLVDRDAVAGGHMRLLKAKQQQCAQLPKVARPPYFCAGCPHNISTVVPEGSRALAGTGCHLMVVGMQRDTSSLLHMGGEGVNWVGQAPFTDEPHIFQNLGDGTYVHSGHLAIRQAVAAGINITYKILYNDAVAMTGGQPLEGAPSVAEICQQIYHEGVKRIAVISQDTGMLRKADLPPGTTLHRRRDLDGVQKELRQWPGVSALIYDWTCATERRRRRKRGTELPAGRRAFINQAVCEGCSDCVLASNCVALTSESTPFGRKRRIDQSACNDDFACVDAYCPAIVTIEGAELRPVVDPQSLLAVSLPLPDPAPSPPVFNLLLAGAGGTGVVTVGRVLGMASHLEGKASSVLDFTGLAQKGGQVLTHVRIAPDYSALHGARIPVAGADVLLAGDTVSATGAEAVACVRAGATTVVVNDCDIPTAADILRPHEVAHTVDKRRQIEQLGGEGTVRWIEASALATRVTGESISANLLLLGHAFQLGRIPLSLTSIEEAIRRNGVAVEANLLSFHCGRLTVFDPERLEQLCGVVKVNDSEAGESLPALMQRQIDFLTAYQNRPYALRYERLLKQVGEIDREVRGGPGPLSEAAAHSYFHLLAYKDEYEVARLHTDGAFRDSLYSSFGDKVKPSYHLAVPFLPGRDPRTGGARKRTFGPWFHGVLRLLSRMRVVRGTPFDVFGWQAERRIERRLIAEFEADVQRLRTMVTRDNYDNAVRLLGLYRQIVGFGPVKMKSVRTVTEQLSAERTTLFGSDQSGAKAQRMAAAA